MRAKPMAVAKSIVERVNQIEPLYDSHEVALQCRVSEKSLHRWARQGLIPAVKVGRLWRFRKSAIDDWLNRKMAS